MIKLKLKKLALNFFFLSLLALPIFGHVQSASAAIPTTDGGNVPKCDPTNDWWCKGACDNSTTDKHGAVVHPLTYAQYQSCKCDGQPNLSGDQLKACVSCQSKTNESDCLADNPITKRINQIIYLLSGLVAVVITGSLIYAGILYSISGESASQIQASKKRIIDSAIALILFILIFSLLQWLIPGGL